MHYNDVSHSEQAQATGQCQGTSNAGAEARNSTEDSFESHIIRRQRLTRPYEEMRLRHMHRNQEMRGNSDVVPPERSHNEDTGQAADVIGYESGGTIIVERRMESTVAPTSGKYIHESFY